MARITMIYREGHGVIVKGGDLDRYEDSMRSHLAAPMVIRDGMAAARHPVTGQMMESKRGFEAATKAAGCVCIGNDLEGMTTPRAPDRPEITATDVAEAYRKVNDGYKPAPMTETAAASETGWTE